MIDKKVRIKFLFLVAFLVLAFIFSFSIGRYPIKFFDVIKVITNRIFYGIIDNSPASTVIWNIRVPRVLCAMLVGAGVSTSGALYQGLLKNPMVSPDILGTTQAAAFGSAFGILMYFNFFEITVVLNFLKIYQLFYLNHPYFHHFQ